MHLQQAQRHEPGDLLHLRTVRVSRQPLRLKPALAGHIQRVGIRQRHDAPAGDQYLQRIEEGLPAGRVEYHVHGLTQHRAEILGAVVDGLGPQRAHELVIRGGGGRKNLRARLNGQLHGEVADASGTGVDEHALAFLQSRHFEERLVGGEPGKRCAAELGARNVGGNLGQLVGGCEDILGVRAAGVREGHHAENAVADFEARIVAGGGDYGAGNIPSGHEGSIGGVGQLRGGAQALAGGHVDGVHARGDRLDEHVTAHRGGDGHVRLVQNAFVAPFGELNLAHGGHGLPPLVWCCRACLNGVRVSLFSQLRGLRNNRGAEASSL